MPGSDWLFNSGSHHFLNPSYPLQVRKFQLPNSSRLAMTQKNLRGVGASEAPSSVNNMFKGFLSTAVEMQRETKDGKDATAITAVS